MNIENIILQSSSLTTGLDELGDFDKNLYLNYLNLVHMDLYKYTALVNPYIHVKRDEFVLTEGRFVNQKIGLFAVKKVNLSPDNNNAGLKHTSYDFILDDKNKITNQSKPVYWYMNNGSIYIYPSIPEPTDLKIIVTYIPEPMAFTIDTLEVDIPYPPIYHQVLVDGLSYYLFQGESGLKSSNELKASILKYSVGKKEMFHYMSNLYKPSTFSTFSNL